MSGRKPRHHENEEPEPHSRSSAGAGTDRSHVVHDRDGRYSSDERHVVLANDSGYAVVARDDDDQDDDQEEQA